MISTSIQAGGMLERTVQSIHPADPVALAAARERQGRLTKPPGALGELEETSIRLAGIAGSCPPPALAPAAVAVFAADHGVHAQGVSPWPQEVTVQMIANFLAGGAAVTVLARENGCAVVVIDVGVGTELDGLIPAGAQAADASELRADRPILLRRAVRAGTADLSLGPAMSVPEAVAALEIGAGVARELVAAGYRCLLTGDMGIANTTASAALIGAFTGTGADEITGRGTGLDDVGHARKIRVVDAALARHRAVVGEGDPIAILAALGGLEHAALAGFILGAAAERVPVILDGVIAGAAALVAAALAPAAVDACIAGHCSAEPGGRVALAALGLTPLIDLGLRLGEGSGAVLALPLARSAVAVLAGMATFDAAGVTEKSS